MKKIGLFVNILISGMFAISAPAQTVTFTTTAMGSKVSGGGGINMGTPNSADTGQMLKNLIGVWNTNFEPIINQQQCVVFYTGTTTTVGTCNGDAPENYWAGATIVVPAGVAGGAEIGCTSKVAGNTPTTIALATPCAAPIKAGDTIQISRTVSPTSEIDWETGKGGVYGNVTGGGRITSVTTGLCPDCGAQSVLLDATASGSTAQLQYQWDQNSSQNLFVLMNGNYQIRFNAAKVSGYPTLAISAARSASGGFSMSCSSTFTSTPGYYGCNFTARETQSTTSPGVVIMNVTASGGSVQLDNISVERVETGTNTTVFRDEVVQDLINLRPGSIRFWNYTSQNGETAANWTNPDTSHACTTSGTAYYPRGCGPNLNDYFQLVKYLSSQLGYTVGIDLEIPLGFTPADITSFEDYIVASSGPMAAKRAANGQSTPYIPHVVPVVHAAFCNECWNNAQPGQYVGYYPGALTGGYGSYGAILSYDLAAFRVNPNYVARQWDLIADAQTGDKGGDCQYYASLAHAPDSCELNGYGVAQINESSESMWTSMLAWPNMLLTPGDLTGLHQAVTSIRALHTCGASKTAQCNVNIYEWQCCGGGLHGSISQTYADYLTAGAGAGLYQVLQQLLMAQDYGIGLQEYFAFEGFDYGGTPDPKIWGAIVDSGGATNLKRPQYLAMETYNTAAVGRMVSCPITGGPTYDFRGDANITFGGDSGMPAQMGIPYLYAACFASASKYGAIFINVDQADAHTLSFAGSAAPSGTVAATTYAPRELDLMNEAATASLPTNRARAKVVLATGSVTDPRSIRLPPHSAVAYIWTRPAGPASEARHASGQTSQAPQNDSPGNK